MRFDYVVFQPALFSDVENCSLVREKTGAATGSLYSGHGGSKFLPTPELLFIRKHSKF